MSSPTPDPTSTASPSRSGVFADASDSRLEAFAESISFDSRMAQQDIRGSKAHARMLATVGLLTETEAESIVNTLEDIGQDLKAGKIPFRFELEDIHMHIESELIDRLGDTGRKLHTARSRNDQVSTDVRLWIREAIDRVDRHLAGLQTAFLSRCQKDAGVILPAYTHLQRAQPVLAAHYWLAYIEKFQRDRERLSDVRKRVNVCPLGVAAVAGTTLPIDRDQTADALGFDGYTQNSLDTSSDRDFLVESAFALSVIATHLSTWSEEWILWSTIEYKFIQIPQAFCTGSSIMPQKVNPDTLELTRGKSARVMGNLQTLMLLTKNLPLAYNRDLQEDKPPLFDSFDTIESILELAIPIVRDSELQRESIESRLEDGYLDATTLMEWLIQKQVPQRTAHHAVGAIVGDAMERGVPLMSLPLDVFQKHVGETEVDKSIYDSLGCKNAVAAFCSPGSTAPKEVQKRVDYWSVELSAEVSATLDSSE